MVYLKVGMLLALSAVAPIACEERGLEDMASRPYPSVETTAVTEIDETGAHMNGTIISLGTEAIVDHGFVYLNDVGPTIDRGNRVSLGAATTTGTFSAFADRSLVKDTKYYVKAYAATDDQIIYGPAVEFIAQGGIAAEVAYFAPLQGVAYDTVVIVGAGFSNVLNANQVRFGSAVAEIVEATGESLTCVVPAFTAVGQNEIVVLIDGVEFKPAEKFTLLPMIIGSFTPSAVTLGTTVSIVGQNFTSYKTSIVATLLGRRAEVLSASPTKIDVIIANTVVIPESAVSLLVGAQTVVTQAKITLLAPMITGFVPSPTTHSADVVINGSNFSPIKENNIVELNSVVTLTVLEASNTALKVRIPAINPGSYNVSVTVATLKTTSTTQLEITN